MDGGRSMSGKAHHGYGLAVNEQKYHSLPLFLPRNTTLACSSMPSRLGTVNEHLPVDRTGASTASWVRIGMIDLVTESVLSLTEAAKRLPQRRMGKRPHIATLYRWATRGLQGTTLETIQVGGTKCTSVEALQRFCNSLSAGDSRENPPSTVTQQRQPQQTARELKELKL